MIKFTKLCSVGLIGCLAACSASSGTNGPSPVGNPTESVLKLNASGAGSGTLSAEALNAALPKIDAISNKLTGSKPLTPPATNPARKATMKGYIQFAVAGQTGDNEAILGNMTVNADFGAAGNNVSIEADGFSEFTGRNNSGKTASTSTLGITGGKLVGSGTISRTAMVSSLNGTVNTKKVGSLSINSNLEGRVYADNERLGVYGLVSGTARGSNIDPAALKSGNFVVTED